MTLTIELNEDEATRLQTKAAKEGLDAVGYLHRLINDLDASPSLGDRIRAVLGDRPVGTGTSNWSEVEAACDTD